MSSKYVTENAGSGFSIPEDGDDELSELFNFESEDDSEEDTSRFFMNPDEGLEDTEEDHDTGETESAFSVADDSDPFDVVSVDESEEIEGLDDFDTVENIEEHAPVEEEPVYEPEPQVEVEPEPEPVLQQPVVESRWASDGYAQQPAYSTSTPQEPEQAYEPEPAPVVEEAPDYYESRRSRRETAAYEQYAPEPAIEERPVQQSSTRRLNIPSEADKIAEVNRVVHVLDVYRNLSPADVKDSVYALMTLDNEPPESEAQVIVKAMNAEPLLFKTIRALSEAKNTDPVERVFYILELPDEVFYNLGNMAIVFTDDDPIEKNQSKTAFARKLVPIIESLEDNVMAVVSAAEKVLEAASGEQE